MQERLPADHHGWWKCRPCRSDYRPTTMDGGSAGYAGAITGRPPWMVEVQVMQEQSPADHHGWWECRLCRSNHRPTTMDGGSAGYAGAITGRPPWMVEVQVMQEQSPAERHGNSTASHGRCIYASMHSRWWQGLMRFASLTISYVLLLLTTRIEVDGLRIPGWLSVQPKIDLHRCGVTAAAARTTGAASQPLLHLAPPDPLLQHPPDRIRFRITVQRNIRQGRLAALGKIAFDIRENHTSALPIRSLSRVDQRRRKAITRSRLDSRPIIHTMELSGCSL